MPDLYDNANLLEKSYEVYAKVQRLSGSPVPDEASFVGGFIACFGIITGRVDIGLDDNAQLTTTLDSIHKDIAAFGQRIAENQARIQERQDGLNRAVRRAAQSAQGKRGN